MFKSKIRGNVQEVILPDFPDDDTTVTTTTTRSRRVSFGTNFVKEFIVGSAVSAQCVSEYEQAFSSSDSSNPNSSLSNLGSGLLGQSTFTVENVKNPVGQNTFTLENHNEQIRQSTFTIENQREQLRQSTFTIENQREQLRQSTFTIENQREQIRQSAFAVENQKENIRQNTFSMEKQKERSSMGGKTFCEHDPNENNPKRPKFSRTICFNIDSPTADMEFTEGCLTLAKTILDKKNKDMRVIIEADSKESGKVDKDESTKHFGSPYDMTLTQCFSGKENKRNKSFQGEKSKVLSSLNDDTENCTLFGRKLPSNFSGISFDDSLKENQMPLDLIMQQLDKNNSDLEDSLYPEKTLNAALKASIFDSDENDDKLSLNDSMDISLDLFPKRGASIGSQEQIQHLSPQLLSENQLPVLELDKSNDKVALMSDKEDSFLEEVEKDINTELAREMGEEEMEISLGKMEETDVLPAKMAILKHKDETLDVRSEERDSGLEKQSLEIVEDIMNKSAFDEKITYSEKENDVTDGKKNIPDSCEISLEVKEGENNELETESFINGTEESKNVSNLSKLNLLIEDRVENTESDIDELRKDESRMAIESYKEEVTDVNKKNEEALKEISVLGSLVSEDQTVEKPAEVMSEPSFVCSSNPAKVLETEEIAEFNKEPLILAESQLSQSQPEKMIDDYVAAKIQQSQMEEYEETINNSPIINQKNALEEGNDKIQEFPMELPLSDDENAQHKVTEKFGDILKTDSEVLKDLESQSEEFKNVSNLKKTYSENKESDSDKFRMNESRGIVECREEEDEANNENEDAIKHVSVSDVNMSGIQAIEKPAEIVSESSFVSPAKIQEVEEIEKFNKEPSILVASKLNQDQPEKMVDDAEIQQSHMEECEEAIDNSPIINHKIAKEERNDNIQDVTMELPLADNENSQKEQSILVENKLSQDQLDEIVIDHDAVETQQSQPEECEEIDNSPIMNHKIAKEKGSDNIQDVPMELALIDDENAHNEPPIPVENQLNQDQLEKMIDDCEAAEIQQSQPEERERATNNSPINNHKIAEEEEPDKIQDVIMELSLTDAENAQNEVSDKFEDISMIDCRILENLKDQSEESNCLWTLKNWKYNARNKTGTWDFNFRLLESYTTLVFHLKVSEEENEGIVKSSSLQLNEEDERRRKEYRPTVEFGFRHQKEYLEENKKMVKTVRQIPYFLDLMNSYMIKLNSYLSQIYSILTLYPGSRLQNSILTFRLFSFPIFFSCYVSLNLTDLYQLSRSSISFDYDFGSLDENKIQDIFEECLKLPNPLPEFIIRSTKYLVDIETEMGRVSKRTYLRLLPPEIRF